MIDIAQAHGVRVDADRLARQLGLPVVPIQANKGKGLDRLREAIAAAADDAPPAPLPFPEPFEREVAALRAEVGGKVEDYLLRRLLLDAGGYTEERLVARLGRQLGEHVRAARARLAAAGCPVPAVEARARYAWIRSATAGCVERPARRPVTWTDRIDRVLTHRAWGSLVFLALMFLVFQAIFTWARPLMHLLGEAKDAVAGWLAPPHGLLPPGPFTSLVVDGVIEGVGAVVVFLPQILILFGFIAVLEDCGYMARAAFLMDKVMARCGLSGKSFIPMLSSVACAVPGILAARVIEDRRDRLATILVAPLMSCSARLPVYILLIGTFLTAGHAWWVPGVTMFAMYALGIVVAPLVALLLKRTLLRGDTPVFVMEMPAYKWPSPRLVVRRMLDAGWAFVRRAGTLILASMVVVWALLYFPDRDADGRPYAARVTALEEEAEALQDQAKAAAAAERDALAAQAEAVEDEVAALKGRWKRQSVLGRLGRLLEPAVRPLGWDWRLGTAALASFPAREVVVGTLGLLYDQGEVDVEEIRSAADPGATKLGQALRAAAWEDGERQGQPVFSVPVALSLMVFFALCCQCASTLAVIRRETRSWRWPVFTFVYMTALAYLGALVVYQVGRLWA
jgi:ferrous iron transport protein B